jgi:Mrp family chromosome partitioning ATPase
VSGPLWYVVEGPDGAGKTSVAMQLASALSAEGGSAPKRPCVLQKLSYESDEGMYVDLPLSLLERGLHVVQDRGALSGLVYEPIIRRDMVRLGWLEDCTRRAADEGAMLLHVTAALPTLEKRLRDRGDDYVTPEQLNAITAGYRGAVERWRNMGGAHTELDTTWSFPGRMEIELAASLLDADRRRPA